MSLELTYILYSIIIFLIIIYFYKKSLDQYFNDSKKVNKNILIFSGGIAIWLIYIFILTQIGILKNLDFPPKFPLLIILPLLSFLIIFYSKNKDNKIIQSITLHQTVFFQSFRIIVEIIIAYTFYKNILPEHASYHGYNYDVLMGITAIPLGYFVYKNKHNLSILKIWNIVGIAMILFVAFIVASSYYFPIVWGENQPNISLAFLDFPYMLLPVFLAPMGIFMHIINLIQIRKK